MSSLQQTNLAAAGLLIDVPASFVVAAGNADAKNQLFAHVAGGIKLARGFCQLFYLEFNIDIEVRTLD